jgi:hypothetical protein
MDDLTKILEGNDRPLTNGDLDTMIDITRCLLSEIKLFALMIGDRELS